MTTSLSYIRVNYCKNDSSIFIICINDPVTFSICQYSSYSYYVLHYAKAKWKVHQRQDRELIFLWRSSYDDPRWSLRVLSPAASCTMSRVNSDVEAIQLCLAFQFIIRVFYYYSLCICTGLSNCKQKVVIKAIADLRRCNMITLLH